MPACWPVVGSSLFLYLLVLGTETRNFHWATSKPFFILWQSPVKLPMQDLNLQISCLSLPEAGITLPRRPVSCGSGLDPGTVCMRPWWLWEFLWPHSEVCGRQLGRSDQEALLWLCCSVSDLGGYSQPWVPSYAVRKPCTFLSSFLTMAASCFCFPTSLLPQTLID